MWRRYELRLCVWDGLAGAWDERATALDGAGNSIRHNDLGEIEARARAWLEKPNPKQWRGAACDRVEAIVENGVRIVTGHRIGGGKCRRALAIIDREAALQ